MAKLDNNIEFYNTSSIIKSPTIGCKIPKCMVVSGDIVSCESIVVEGRVDGDIISVKKVIIKKGAVVNGMIKAKEVRVEGSLKGPIEADIIEISKDGKSEGYLIGNKIAISGKSDGDILSKETLFIDKGAYVNSLEIKSKVTKVLGRVKGFVESTEVLEVLDDGVVDGDVKTKDLLNYGNGKVFGKIYRYVG